MQTILASLDIFIKAGVLSYEKLLDISCSNENIRTRQKNTRPRMPGYILQGCTWYCSSLLLIWIKLITWYHMIKKLKLDTLQCRSHPEKKNALSTGAYPQLIYVCELLPQ